MFVHKNVIDVGVNSAILQFSDVLSAISNVFMYFGIQNGCDKIYFKATG